MFDFAPLSPSSVSLFREDGKWKVVVREDAHFYPANEFSVREFASSFADGQRIRLGLPAIHLSRPLASIL